MKAGSLQPLAGPLGVEAVTAYLDRRGLHHELVTHKPTFRAVDDAAASGVPPHHELKTLVLRGAEGLILAALGASERLDLHKARGGRPQRLAGADPGGARKRGEAAGRRHL